MPYSVTFAGVDTVVLQFDTDHPGDVRRGPLARKPRFVAQPITRPPDWLHGNRYVHFRLGRFERVLDAL